MIQFAPRRYHGANSQAGNTTRLDIQALLTITIMTKQLQSSAPTFISTLTINFGTKRHTNENLVWSSQTSTRRSSANVEPETNHHYGALHDVGTGAQYNHHGGSGTENKHPAVHTKTEIKCEHSQGTGIEYEHLEEMGTEFNHPDETGTEYEHQEETGIECEHPEETGTEYEHPEETGTQYEHQQETGTEYVHQEETCSEHEHPEETGTKCEHQEETGTEYEHPEKTGTQYEHQQETGSEHEYPETGTQKQQEGTAIVNLVDDGIEYSQPEDIGTDRHRLNEWLRRLNKNSEYTDETPSKEFNTFCKGSLSDESLERNASLPELISEHYQSPTTIYDIKYGEIDWYLDLLLRIQALEMRQGALNSHFVVMLRLAAQTRAELLQSFALVVGAASSGCCTWSPKTGTEYEHPEKTGTQYEHQQETGSEHEYPETGTQKQQEGTAIVSLMDDGIEYSQPEDIGTDRHRLNEWLRRLNKNSEYTDETPSKEFNTFCKGSPSDESLERNASLPELISEHYQSPTTIYDIKYGEIDWYLDLLLRIQALEMRQGALNSHFVVMLRLAAQTRAELILGRVTCAWLCCVTVLVGVTVSYSGEALRSEYESWPIDSQLPPG
ncbi:predicted protein [Nematostella vectensis]|uniref:Uncharacterized protein n=1 Tax=Nematostella vectensis TaxID=45351 RepID=A7SKY4_NEMVE|nr:predicted protein [Nematostella vectensis]|eukprot:XP_001627757.1 predicted protein [Nematostella vectensis]